MDLSIQGRFAAQVRQAPEALAASSSDLRLTYRELDERANQLAHRLLALGTSPETPVAILMERSAELLVAILAVVKAGGFYLPLHNGYPLERMQWIMNDAGSPILLADRSTMGRGLPLGSQLILVDADKELAGLRTSDPNIPAHPDQLAYVMYTSGSTGHPKGVGVTHEGVLGLTGDQIWAPGRYDRVLMVAPYAFSVSTYELWVPLLRGGQVVLAPPGHLDVASLRRMIIEHDVTAVHLTAGLFRVVAEEDPDCLATVREVLTGGDVIAPLAVQRVLEACPATVVRATYGATETTLFTTTKAMAAPFREGSRVPVGYPMNGIRAYVLDERLQPVPAGVEGELYIGGGRLARGYFNRADLTAASFVADPFTGDGQRMYRTGDLVRRTADGLIDFIGRGNDQVKIRGFRVELGEVEAVLGRYPGLAQVAVVAQETEAGEKRLAAYVVPGLDGVQVAGLRRHALAALPDYMVPAEFVVLDALPLTLNGKVDRKALPGLASAETGSYAAPRTARQEVLCALFAEVLGVEQAGINDGFFDLNGDSLLAMRLISRIQSELGVSLVAADLFDAPSVAELDARLGNGDLR